MKTLFEYIGKTLIAFIPVLISSVVSGYVLVMLWKWFMVPTFHLPLLTTSQALGIALLISYIAGNNTGEHKIDESKSFAVRLTVRLIMTLIWAVLTLLTGWIYLKWF